MLLGKLTTRNIFYLMKKKLLLFILLPLFSMAQKETLWRLEIPSPGGAIPVHLLLSDDGRAFAINADEKLEFDRVFTVKDTLHLRLELYDLELILAIKNGKLNGLMNKRGADMLYRQVPFTGTANDPARFKNTRAAQPLAPKYQVTFKNESSGKESPAIGVFQVDNGKVKGSFLTNTGDYRYLQGNVAGDSLYLSALGSSAVMYKARIKGDSLTGGTSYTPFGKGSGFSGVKNESYELPDATKLTFLKEGQERFDFTFKDINGRDVSLSDPRFKGKVTVVQILGTWCPNCLDETRFLTEYKKENPLLEVIGLAFERNSEPSFAWPKIGRFIERFGVDYPVLLAGTIQEAGEKLPQLNHVMAFPTSIIVDKKGQVRKIHTGFTGPGTGSYYDQYVKEFAAFVKELQAE